MNTRPLPMIFHGPQCPQCGTISHTYSYRTDRNPTPTISVIEADCVACDHVWTVTWPINRERKTPQ